ncbi:MAG TPA: CheR family methyltransferase [Nitrospirota bacterium]|nr:CheR family methyltransferase [Nitrospirota bacterium]
MAIELSQHALLQVSELISSLMGLYFNESRWNDLKHGIESASVDFGFNDSEAFIQWLRSSSPDRKIIEVLASHLTVGETYFFRDNDVYRLLEDRILPELITSRHSSDKRLRIWSAGCSTGEEAYSIAILLTRIMADLKDWNITILATDINPVSLKKASEGRYTEWSFRDTPSWIRDHYFRQNDHRLYELLPSVKKMVSFSYLNLAEDVYPSLLNNTNAMDIIFCRNVLMYFSPQTADKVIKGLANSLTNGGRLFLSPADAIRPITEVLVPEHFQGVTAHRREYQRSHPLTAPPPEIESQQATDTAVDKTAAYQDSLSLFNNGNFRDAEKGLEQLVRQGYDEPQVDALFARTYANQGRMSEAIKWCEKAIAGDRLNPSYYYLLATILYEEGRFEEAMKFLRKTIYLDADFIIASFMLGNIKLRVGDIKGAKTCFKNVLGMLSRRDPADVLEGSDGITAGRLAEIIDSMNAWK